MGAPAPEHLKADEQPTSTNEVEVKEEEEETFDPDDSSKVIHRKIGKTYKAS